MLPVSDEFVDRWAVKDELSLEEGYESKLTGRRSEGVQLEEFFHNIPLDSAHLETSREPSRIASPGPDSLVSSS